MNLPVIDNRNNPYTRETEPPDFLLVWRSACGPKGQLFVNHHEAGQSFDLIREAAERYLP